jgi:hypothetical protein
VHFSRRFKAVSKELADSILRMENRVSVMKTKEVTGITSQELVSFLFSAIRI